MVCWHSKKGYLKEKEKLVIYTLLKVDLYWLSQPDGTLIFLLI